MSLIKSLQVKLRRFSEELIPQARKRLDHLNRSLAEQALPEERRRRVSELTLGRKAKKAGQKNVTPRPAEGSSAASKDKQDGQ